MRTTAEERQYFVKRGYRFAFDLQDALRLLREFKRINHTESVYALDERCAKYAKKIDRFLKEKL